MVGMRVGGVGSERQSEYYWFFSSTALVEWALSCSRIDLDSDREVESEEDMQDPYPLEGKYKDESDKRE